MGIIRPRLLAARRFAAAALVVSAPAAGTATVGDPDETYPVRFRVRASAIFAGESTDEFGEDHDIRWTRKEKDVLSFDDEGNFHWETPLRNDLPLSGWYVPEEDRKLRMVTDLGPHHVIRQYRFPWIRVRGCILREVHRLKLSKDGTKIRGTEKHRTRRWRGEDRIEGTVWIKFRGERI